MSAWMFDSDQMNRVVDAINFAAKNGCPTPLTLLSQPSAGRALFEMNAEALRQRYSDADKSGYNEYDKNWVYKPSKPPIDEMQLCKTLHCFLYQCSEGDVPEKSARYKQLQEICNWFDDRVGNKFGDFHNTPEWQTAVWG